LLEAFVVVCWYVTCVIFCHVVLDPSATRGGHE